jgi:hypothetical protein
MNCIRCGSVGTHTEWLKDGKMQPIIRLRDNRACALCDVCYALYEELSTLEASLLASGLSREETNAHLKMRILGKGASG